MATIFPPIYTNPHYQDVRNVRAELARVNLPTNGNKKELARRLLKHKVDTFVPIAIEDYPNDRPEKYYLIAEETTRRASELYTGAERSAAFEQINRDIPTMSIEELHRECEKPLTNDLIELMLRCRSALILEPIKERELAEKIGWEAVTHTVTVCGMLYGYSGIPAHW